MNKTKPHPQGAYGTVGEGKKISCSFNKHLRAYCVPGTDVGAGDLAINKTLKSLLSWTFLIENENKYMLKGKTKEGKENGSVQRFTEQTVTLWRWWVYIVHSRSLAVNEKKENGW